MVKGRTRAARGRHANGSFHAAIDELESRQLLSRFVSIEAGGPIGLSNGNVVFTSPQLLGWTGDAGGATTPLAQPLTTVNSVVRSPSSNWVYFVQRDFGGADTYTARIGRTNGTLAGTTFSGTFTGGTTLVYRDSIVFAGDRPVVVRAGADPVVYDADLSRSRPMRQASGELVGTVRQVAAPAGKSWFTFEGATGAMRLGEIQSVTDTVAIMRTIEPDVYGSLGSSGTSAGPARAIFHEPAFDAPGARTRSVNSAGDIVELTGSTGVFNGYAVSSPSAAWLGAADGLYRSDGTVAGTKRVVDAGRGVRPIGLLGNTLIFLASTSTRQTLGAIDTAVADAVPRAIESSKSSSYDLDHVASAGGRLYLAVNGIVHATDGVTLAPAPAVFQSYPYEVQTLNGGNRFIASSRDGVTTLALVGDSIAVPKISVPATGSAADVMTLGADGTVDPDGDRLERYEWDLNGDGTPEYSTTKSKLVLVPGDLGKQGIDGPATLRAGVRVVSFGQTSPYVYKSIVYADAPPVLTAYALKTTTPLRFGVDLRATATDPGGDAITSIRAEWGDGTSSKFSRNTVARAYHRYDKPGKYTVRIIATDADGSVTSLRRKVTVLPTAPAPAAGLTDLGFDQPAFVARQPGGGVVTLGKLVVAIALDPPADGVWTTDPNQRLVATDGTRDGIDTLLVASSIKQLVKLDASRAVFVIGRDRELWVTTGMRDGTQRLLKVGSGAIDSAVAFAGKVYFVLNGNLWMTDGTVEGTLRVPDSRKYLSDVGTPVVMDGKLWFAARERDRADAPALWSIDPAGVRQRITLLSGGKGHFDASTQGGRLFLRGASAQPDPQTRDVLVFLSRGTAETTVPTKLGAAFGIRAIAGGPILLSGTGTYGSNADTADDFLWRCGDDGKITSIANFNRGASDDIGFLATVGKTMIISAENGTGRQVYRTDGTAKGTYAITGKGTPAGEIGAGVSYTVSMGTSVGGMGFFVVTPHKKAATLFRTDGTRDGTFALATGAWFHAPFAFGKSIVFESADKLYTTHGVRGDVVQLNFTAPRGINWDAVNGALNGVLVADVNGTWGDAPTRAWLLVL